MKKRWLSFNKIIKETPVISFNKGSYLQLVKADMAVIQHGQPVSWKGDKSSFDKGNQCHDKEMAIIQ